MSCNNTVYIYGLFDPRNGKLRYIGKTKNPKQRLYYHTRDIEGKNSYTHKEAWIKQLSNLGFSPILSILEEVKEDSWKEAEQWWIVLVKNIGYKLVNMTNGGEGFGSGVYHYLYGKHISEEQKINLSLNRKGSNNPMYGKVGANKGKTFTQGHKEKLKLSHLGKKQSLETKIKRSLSFTEKNNPQFGRVRPEEHCKKISDSLKGKILTEEQKRKRLYAFAMNSCFKKGKVNCVYILQKEYYIRFGEYHKKYPILS